MLIELILSLISLFSAYFLWDLCTREPTNDEIDAVRTLEQIVESRGLKCEHHELTTVDGYVLSIHRLVHPLGPKPGKVVLLQHGEDAYGAQWVCNDSTQLEDPLKYDNGKIYDNALGICLAKRGYDVWLPSFRGTRRSRGHVKYSSKYSPDYWKFTLDEIIALDMPLFIDHVLSATGSKTISFVGTSMGTTLMFGLLSSQPKYNDLLKPCIALAPCWRLSNMKSPVKLLSAMAQKIYNYLPCPLPVLNEYHETAIIWAMNRNLFARPVQLVTYAVINLVCGFNISQWNIKRLGTINAHMAYVLGPKKFIHSTQYISQSRPLSKFDYGKEKNLEIYGTETSPIYDIGRITNKYLCFLYAKNDWAVDLEDIQYAKDCLKVPLYVDHLEPDPNWSHLDFIYSHDTGKVVNSRIVEILENCHV